MQAYVENIRKLGGVVNTAIVLGGAEAIIADRKRCSRATNHSKSTSVRRITGPNAYAKCQSTNREVLVFERNREIFFREILLREIFFREIFPRYGRAVYKSTSELGTPRSLYRTASRVPMVSTIERFHCTLVKMYAHSRG